MGGKVINNKEETKRTYNRYAEIFDIKFQENFSKFGIILADEFLIHLNKNSRIIDLGSGPGHFGAYAKKYGFDVLCIDNSKKMIMLCQQKGLSACLMDAERLRLNNESFEGVWSYALLPHIKKRKVPYIAEEIARILKPGGILALSVLEGRGEGFEERHYHPGAKRWFSYFTDYELASIFRKNFSALYSDRSIEKGTTKEYVFLKYLLRVKK